MALFLTNTLSGKKEKFVPLEENVVKIYTCGMTVQDEPHLGHMRAFVMADVLRRYLEFNGYKTIQVVNFTDVEDRVLQKAQELKTDWRGLAQENIDQFFFCADQLNILRATYYPRATQYIQEIITFIERLEKKGLAYNVDGDVYFEVKIFNDYGKLSKKKIDDLIAGSRVEVDLRKKAPMDFALWKKAKPGEPWWQSPWGRGRPGWHIECSAMAMHLLGDAIDIHTGGEDLIFPHHENEIAQSEGATGKQFVNYWIHNGILNLTGEKMSKSTGHFFSVKDILGRFDANAIRLYLLKSHYRGQIDYREERLIDAKNGYERIANFFGFFTKPEQYEEIIKLNNPLRLKDFIGAMDDDLNTPQALSVIFDLVSEGFEALHVDKKFEVAKKFYESAACYLLVLGFNLKEQKIFTGRENELVNLILKVRNQLREAEIFAVADQIREELYRLGFIVDDEQEKSRWRRR